MATARFNERYPCPLCDRFHSIRECSKFMVMPIPQRREKVVELRLCRNCLAHSHQRADCTSKDRCFRCQRNHHSMVHPMDPKHFWFPMTAMAKLLVGDKKTGAEIRLLIDPNTKISSITLEAVERHNCVTRHGYTTVKLQHRLFDRPPIEVRCVVVDKDYPMTPRYDINRDWASHHPIVVKNNAADKWWFKSYRYFMILGSDVSHKVFRGGGASGKPGEVCLQHTVFGLAYFGEATPAEYDLKRFERENR